LREGDTITEKAEEHIQRKADVQGQQHLPRKKHYRNAGRETPIKPSHQDSKREKPQLLTKGNATGK